MESYQDLYGPFGSVNGLAGSLLIQGINFNDLKPGCKRHLGPDCPESEYAIARAEESLVTWGLSVEDLKEGTFYSYLENGKDLNGVDVSKEDALRIIKETNDKLKNEYHNRTRMTEEEMANARETFEEFGRQLGFTFEEEEKDDQDKMTEIDSNGCPIPAVKYVAEIFAGKILGKPGHCLAVFSLVVFFALIFQFFKNRTRIDVLANLYVF